MPGYAMDDLDNQVLSVQVLDKTNPWFYFPDYCYRLKLSMHIEIQYDWASAIFERSFESWIYRGGKRAQVNIGGITTF